MMAIPVATTTITVRRRQAQYEADADLPYAEPPELAYTTVATGVRAVLSLPRMHETAEGSTVANRAIFRFMADPADVEMFDLVEDEKTGQLYEVIWVTARTGLLGDMRLEGNLALPQGPLYSTA